MSRFSRKRERISRYEQLLARGEDYLFCAREKGGGMCFVDYESLTKKYYVHPNSGVGENYDSIDSMCLITNQKNEKLLAISAGSNDTTKVRDCKITTFDVETHIDAPGAYYWRRTPYHFRFRPHDAARHFQRAHEKSHISAMIYSKKHETLISSSFVCRDRCIMNVQFWNINSPEMKYSRWGEGTRRWCGVSGCSPLLAETPRCNIASGFRGPQINERDEIPLSRQFGPDLQLIRSEMFVVGVFRSHEIRLIDINIQPSAGRRRRHYCKHGVLYSDSNDRTQFRKLAYDSSRHILCVSDNRNRVLLLDCSKTKKKKKNYLQLLPHSSSIEFVEFVNDNYIVVGGSGCDSNRSTNTGTFYIWDVRKSKKVVDKVCVGKGVKVQDMICVPRKDEIVAAIDKKLYRWKVDNGKFELKKEKEMRWNFGHICYLPKNWIGIRRRVLAKSMGDEKDRMQFVRTQNEVGLVVKMLGGKNIWVFRSL